MRRKETEKSEKYRRWRRVRKKGWRRRKSGGHSREWRRRTVEGLAGGTLDKRLGSE